MCQLLPSTKIVPEITTRSELQRFTATVAQNLKLFEYVFWFITEANELLVLLSGFETYSDLRVQTDED